MPFITTWKPIFENLPEQLYDGIFKLIHNPPGEPKIDLYLFHDRTWAANSTHLLGWSREIIHTLKLPPLEWPIWLIGHSFKRDTPTTYKLSASNSSFLPKKLVEMATEADDLLRLADVTVDQWGGTHLEDWPAAIAREHDKVIRHHSEIAHRKMVGHDVKFHVMRANYSNSVHHPAYPEKD